MLDKVELKMNEIIGALKYLYSREFEIDNGGCYAEELVAYRDSRVRRLMDEFKKIEKESRK